MKKRIETLDIARGLAIVGTLGTNIWLFANIERIATSEDVSSLLWVVYALMGLLTNGKFLGLLAILFGIGMQLKYNSTLRHGRSWYKVYLWAMTLLFIDGLLHYIFVFEYDVLMSYALTGMFLSFFMPRSDRTILIVALVGGLTHFMYQTYQYVVGNIALPSTQSIVEASTWGEQIILRITNFWAFRAEALMILPMNIFLFGIGIYLVRKGLLRTTKEAYQMQRRLLIYGFGIGIPLVIGTLFSDYLGSMSRYIVAPIVAFGYLGFVFWIVRRGYFSRVQKGLANIGKMALTCYVGQNIVGIVLFYRWGFNLASYESLSIILLAYFGIIGGMILFSTYWLSRHKRGPLETIRYTLEKRAWT